MVWSGIQQFGTQGIGFIISMVLTRLLAPADFGLLGMIGIFIALGFLFMDSGVNASVMRTKDPDEDDYSTIFYFNLFGGTVMYLVMFLIAPAVSWFYERDELTLLIRVYSFTFIFWSFSTTQRLRLVKTLNFKRETVIQLPAHLFSGVVGIILAYQGFGVWSMVWAALLKPVFIGIQYFYYFRWLPLPRIDFQKLRHHFKYGSKLTLSGLLEIVFSNLNHIVIGKMFSASSLGFYTRAQTMMLLPVESVNGILNRVTFPLFAAIQDDDTRLISIFKRMQQMAIFLLVPVYILLNILAEPLFRFLFTEKWLPAVPYFRILALAGFMYPMHIYNLTVLKVKGRSDLFLKAEVWKKVVQGLPLLLVIPFGIEGLLWGYLGFSFIAVVINCYFSGKVLNYGIWNQLFDLKEVFLLGLTLAGFIYLLDRYILEPSLQDFPRLIFGGLSSLFLYFGLGLIFKLPYALEVKAMVWNRVFKKSI